MISEGYLNIGYISLCSHGRTVFVCDNKTYMSRLYV